jgi:ribosomal protein S18 acetylase RimI-like enzyme
MVMGTPIVRHTTATDESAVIDTIVLAFSGDPMARWCWPASSTYLASMPAFARAFAGGAFEHETAHCTDDVVGGALWLAPGIAPDEEAAVSLLERTTSDAIRDDLFAVFEQMASYHPDEPHWYLPLIGVDPAAQGRGCGSALLSYALERCDREHAPAYLESSNPRNIPLYERHGFERLGRIQVGRSPQVVPMLRRPR